MHDDIDKLLVGGAFHHELDRLGAEGGELVVEAILRHAGVVVGRQVGFVDAAEGDAHDRQRQCNEQAADGQGQALGPAHGPARQLVPPGVLNGAGRAGGAAHRPQIDLGPEHAKQGGQDGDGQQGRQADGGNRAIGNGLQEGLGEEEESGERDGDHRRGKDHCLPGGGGGGGHRILGGASLVQFLAEAGDHK